MDEIPAIWKESLIASLKDRDLLMIMIEDAIETLDYRGVPPLVALKELALRYRTHVSK